MCSSPHRRLPYFTSVKDKPVFHVEMYLSLALSSLCFLSGFGLEITKDGKCQKAWKSERNLNKQISQTVIVFYLFSEDPCDNRSSVIWLT